MVVVMKGALGVALATLLFWSVDASRDLTNVRKGLSTASRQDCEAAINSCIGKISSVCVEAVLSGSKDSISECCNEVTGFLGCLGPNLPCLPEDVQGAAMKAAEICRPETCGEIIANCASTITPKCLTAVVSGNDEVIVECCSEVGLFAGCIGDDTQCLTEEQQGAVENATEVCSEDTCVEKIADCAVNITPKCVGAVLGGNEELILQCCNEIDSFLGCLGPDLPCLPEAVQGPAAEAAEICRPDTCGEILANCASTITPECLTAVVSGNDEVIVECCSEVGLFAGCIGDDTQCLTEEQQGAVENATEVCSEDTCVEKIADCAVNITPKCVGAVLGGNEELILQCCNEIDSFLGCLGPDLPCLPEAVQGPAAEAAEICRPDTCGEILANCASTITPECLTAVVSGNDEVIVECCSEVGLFAGCIGDDTQCLTEEQQGAVENATEVCSEDTCVEKIADCAVNITPKCVGAVLGGNEELILQCCNEIDSFLGCLGPDLPCLPEAVQGPAAEAAEICRPDTCGEILANCASTITPKCLTAVVVGDDAAIAGCCGEVNLFFGCIGEDTECIPEDLQAAAENAQEICSGDSCVEIVADCAVNITPTCVAAVSSGLPALIEPCCTEIIAFSDCIDGDVECLPESVQEQLEGALDVCGNSGNTGVFFEFPCKGRVLYKVTLNWNWSAASHPNSYPTGGGLSPFTIASHGAEYTMWGVLGYSSLGVEKVAQAGDTTELVNELKAQNYRNVLQRAVDDGPSSGTATREYALEVNGSRAYLSGITMTFPSPDWFSGFSNVNTCNMLSRQYKDKIVGNLRAYDAGTDDGREFTSPPDPLPAGERRPITDILVEHFEGIPLGTYTIEKVNEDAA